MNQIQNDEIDVFELFRTLWNSKWLISTFIILTTLMGFVYSQVVQPKYNVSVPYTIDMFSVKIQQLCNYSFNCMKSEEKKRLLFFLKAGWGPNLSFSTTTPLDLSVYEAQLVRAKEAYTNEMYVNAKTELAFIRTELDDAVLNTEIIAKSMLHAKRIINSIDSGQSAMTFGSVSIVKSSLKVQLILAFSAVLGGMFGIFFIIVRNAIKKRIEQLSKE